MDPVHDHAGYTTQLRVKLPGAQSWAHITSKEQGIGHDSTMDWHREVKKHHRMVMAVENMAHGNMSVYYVVINATTKKNKSPRLT